MKHLAEAKQCKENIFPRKIFVKILGEGTNQLNEIRQGYQSQSKVSEETGGT